LSKAAEIIERLQDAGVDISNDQINIVWTTVYSPKYHRKIKQIVNALSHDVPQPASKMAYPLTYDYIAIQITPQESPNNQEYTDFESQYDNIDTMLDFPSHYICTLTSTSITELAVIDLLFSTTTTSSVTGNGMFNTSRTKLLAQLILDRNYTSKNGTYEQSPVDKLTLSKNKGCYNLFTTKEQANQLVEYTEHLLVILPQWLEGTAHNKGKCIPVSTKPALHHAKRNRGQNQNTPPIPPQAQQKKPYPWVLDTEQHLPAQVDKMMTHPHTYFAPTPPNHTIPSNQPQQNNTMTTGNTTQDMIHNMKQQLDNLAAVVTHQSELLSNIIVDTKTLTTHQASVITPTDQLQSVILRVDSSITTASNTYMTYTTSTKKETQTMLTKQFQRETDQINTNNNIQHKNLNVMHGDMKSNAKNYNGISRNYGTSINGVVAELIENKMTLVRLSTQIDYILTNMANNPGFLKNTAIWDDLAEHQEAFDRVQHKLDEQYRRGRGTTTSSIQGDDTDKD
jgi:hypothetical protein